MMPSTVDSSFSISMVNSIYQPETVVQRQFTFREASDLFTSFRETNNKNSVPAYSGAVYGKTLYRSKNNVIAMSSVVVDFDNEMKLAGGLKQCSVRPVLPKDLESNLATLPYFFHSTYSNTPDWPRWRLIIPLDRHVNRAECPYVFSWILGQLGEYAQNIDKTCFEVSRHFLLPSYSVTNRSEAFAGYSNGQGVVHVC